MKWMDLSLSMPGCTLGIYARDAVYLHDLPRLTDHVFIGAANRCSQLEPAVRHVMAWSASPESSPWQVPFYPVHACSQSA